MSSGPAGSSVTTRGGADRRLRRPRRGDGEQSGILGCDVGGGKGQHQLLATRRRVGGVGEHEEMGQHALIGAGTEGFGQLRCGGGGAADAHDLVTNVVGKEVLMDVEWTNHLDLAH
jgi:hypothetical protein